MNARKLFYTKRKCLVITICIGIMGIFTLHLNLQARMEMESRAIKHSPTTPATKRRLPKYYSWMKQSDPMIHLNEDNLRCKAVDLGCFSLVQDYKPTDTNTPATSRLQCLDKCFRSSLDYAGYHSKKKLCYCGDKFNNFVTTKSMDAAVSAEQAKNCASSKSVRVFQRSRDCERGISKKSLKLDRVGCMRVPPKMHNLMVALKMPDVTPEQCILNCELRRFTFAVLAQHVNSCICSDSLSLFKTADNMFRTMKECPDSEVSSVGLVPVYHTLTSDRHCGAKHFLLPRQAPQTVLASYYGSGNTWLRHLIEEATGIYTGSIYNDDKLYRGGFIGEKIPYSSGRIIVVKDHMFKYKIKPGYKSAILLLRNPYHATISEYTRMVTHNHTGTMEPDVLRTEKFRRFSVTRAAYWFNMPRAVLREMKSVLVVYYEHLVSNPVQQLRRIVKFLPKNLVKSSGDELEIRLMCMVQDLQGNFKREPKELDFSPFNVAARNAFDTAIRELDEILTKAKQPPLPDSYFMM